jgi:hypothetical protein
MQHGHMNVKLDSVESRVDENMFTLTFQMNINLRSTTWRVLPELTLMAGGCQHSSQATSKLAKF